MKKEEFLIGQDEVLAYLDRIIENENFHHAYLFLGLAGVGRLTASRYFAMGINCEALIKPCLECTTCRNIMKDIYFDVRTFKKDKKTVLSIKYMKEVIIKESFLYPIEAKKKVFILYPESFNEESANAFLKTLEEPSNSTIFILIAQNKEKLFPTIASRCIPVTFKRLDDITLKKILSTDYPPADIDGVLPYSRGSVKIARFLLDSKFCDVYKNFEELFFSNKKSEIFNFIITEIKRAIKEDKEDEKIDATDGISFKDIYILFIDLFIKKLTDKLYDNSLQKLNSPLKEKFVLKEIINLREGLSRDLNADIILPEALMRMREVMV
ncbi:MAG: hypothetical protein AB1765_08805 [Candidatus Hydrogenedentota bacterium]